MSVRSQRGQASVEVIAVIPALLMVGLGLLQLLAVGYAATLAGAAAEAGAMAVAGGADPTEAARASVPGWSRAGMRLEQGGGRVQVTLQPPSPIDALRRRLSVEATAAVAP
jgi:type II secretory pathway component PulM